MTPYGEIQQAIYEEYDNAISESDGEIDTDQFGFAFLVPGGGDYSNMEVEIEDYYVDYKNEKIVVGTQSSVEHYRREHS